jgi:hypothetical protein
MVLDALGTGFLANDNALVHELRKSGLAVSQQHPMVVRYDAIVVACISACYSTSASLALRSNASPGSIFLAAGPTALRGTRADVHPAKFNCSSTGPGADGRLTARSRIDRRFPIVSGACPIDVAPSIALDPIAVL